MLKEYTKRGVRYLCAFIKKEISMKNRGERAQYKDNYIYDPLFGYFDYIIYINEIYVDLTL